MVARQVVIKDLNRLEVDELTLSEIATRVAGSSDLFDEPALHGNRCPRTCFSFDNDDPEGILVRATRELDVDLLAEPWGAREGTYQLGNFPTVWAMWNDRFRDATVVVRITKRRASRDPSA